MILSGIIMPVLLYDHRESHIIKNDWFIHAFYCLTGLQYADYQLLTGFNSEFRILNSWNQKKKRVSSFAEILKCFWYMLNTIVSQLIEYMCEGTLNYWPSNTNDLLTWPVGPQLRHLSHLSLNSSSDTHEWVKKGVICSSEVLKIEKNTELYWIPQTGNRCKTFLPSCNKNLRCYKFAYKTDCWKLSLAFSWWRFWDALCICVDDLFLLTGGTDPLLHHPLHHHHHQIWKRKMCKLSFFFFFLTYLGKSDILS